MMLLIIVASPGLDIADFGGEIPEINLPNLPQDLRHSDNQQREYPYYEIYDQDTLEFLMVVDFRVYPGDEFVTPDNRLFHVNYVEGNRAYAAFVRRVRLTK
ncbi:MAG: hypothetical protein HPY71_07115 [Firmicutes bacterium]|nr:hypothetical protein [Bacillota bacterium]